MFPKAVFSRLFPILGIKNWETIDIRKYKGRIVVQGSNMRDVDGRDAIFVDTSSAPSNMAAMKSVFIFGCIAGGSSTVDAEQAYIQPLLPEDEIVFVVIPPELLTPQQKEMAERIIDPVFRLRRPLYGMKRSGKIWEDHLNLKLKELGWKPVLGWPQTYTKENSTGNTVALTVYVDDMLMAGVDHKKEWQSIRKAVLTTEPVEVSRILGLYFGINSSSTGITLGKWQMDEYCQQAIQMYNGHSRCSKVKEGSLYPVV